MNTIRMLAVCLSFAAFSAACNKGGAAGSSKGTVTIVWDSPASTATHAVSFADFGDPAWTQIEIVANCPQIASALTNGSVDTNKLPTACPDFRRLTLSIEQKVKPGKYEKGVHLAVDSAGDDKPHDTLGDPIAGKGVEITKVTADELQGNIDYQDSRGRSVKGSFVAKR